MKYIHQLFILVFTVTMSGMTACNLVDVTDVKPVYQLSESEVITDIPSAEKVLTGAYGLLNNSLEMIVYLPGMTSLMGLTFQPGTFAGVSENSFYNNNPAPDNYYIQATYTKCYEVINVCNHIIEKTGLLNTGSARKEEIIGEAKFLRALINFDLLRHFGQFYDMESHYGIVLHTTPVENIDPYPRNAVKECYDTIIQDLDYAIQYAPDYTTAVYASKSAALGLKSKVLLYAGQYLSSADAANTMIQSGKVHLEEKFAYIFKDSVGLYKFHSKECLFATPFDARNERNNKSFMFRAYYLPSHYYDSVLTGDVRKPACITVTTTGALRNAKFPGAVVDNQPLTAETEYFLRLDEVYLILAEDYARMDKPDDARTALNVIRHRAGMPDNYDNDKAALLESIRREKVLELGGENGEEWFDLVRYAVNNDLDIAAFKPGVQSENRYILPIPLNSINASKNVVKQNPGY